MNLLTIFVFVLIIILIYAVYKLMTKTTTTVSGFSDATKAVSVPCDKYGINSNFGYSVWVYIDAWQNTVDSADSDKVFKKNILTRCTNSKTNPSFPAFNLYLDNDQNNLNLLINGTAKPCTIRNVQLQKWINITMSIYGNTVDLYLDGKLVRTCVLTATPTTLTTNDILYVGGVYKSGSGSCVATDNGDLNGYISNVVYKADYFTPEEAWSIYSNGYSGSGMFDFIHRYKLNFSLTKDNQTLGQVSV